MTDPVLAVARLRVLGGFALELDGIPAVLGAGGRRLLALLALRGPIPRFAAAELLWPDVDDTQGAGRLRTTLWRVARVRRDLIGSVHGRLALSPVVDVDLDAVTGAARALERLGGTDAGDVASSVFCDRSGELLPGWYDDWVLAEQERIRQLRLHGWEATARHHRDREQYASAVDAALEAVRLDPLRESARRVLVEIHLHEGNPTEAVRAYRTYETVLREELDATPSRHLRSLLESATTAPGRTGATGGG